MPYKIFISHAGEDVWAAYKLSLGVKAEGAECFLDQEDISEGEDFEQVILEELGIVNELWLLLTPNSLKKPYVWLEVGAAWYRQIPITSIAMGVTKKEIAEIPYLPRLIKQRIAAELDSIEADKKLLRKMKKRMDDFRKKTK